MQQKTPSCPFGWKIFPLHPGTKKPIHDRWQDIATDDPAQHAAWAAEFPGCNWAMAAGPSGLAMLDIDGGQIGENSLAEFEINEGCLPETREHRTARGGRHLIFSDPERKLRNSASRLGPKLDTRAGNGYIVIPPSTFEGGSYEVSQDRPVVPLPGFVVDALGRAQKHTAAAVDTLLDTGIAVSRATTLVRDYVVRGHVAVEGSGGDDTTYAVAAEILNLGISVDKAEELLQPWNDACDPPWSEEELRVKIINANNYSQNDTGAWAVPPVTDRIPRAALDKLIADSDSTPKRVSTGRFDWMDEDEFTHMQPPVWLLKDIFTRDSIAMLYGPSGHYKSFIAMSLGAEVAQHGECAFYVAAEGLARMARKDYPAWKAAYGETHKLPFYMVDEMPLVEDPNDYVQFAESIKAKAEGRSVGIIFLDTLNRAMLGLEENSAKDASRVIQAALFLKKAFKCCVCVIHHTPKEGKEMRGSSAFYAGFDTVLHVVAEKEVKLVRMHVTKQKTDEERAYPFCYEGRMFAGGLAFVHIDGRAAAQLSDETNVCSPRNIMAALTELNAFNPVHVSARILTEKLTPQLQNETEADRKTSVERVAKALAAAVKQKKLDGFHLGGRWMLPSPNTNPDS